MSIQKRWIKKEKVTKIKDDNYQKYTKLTKESANELTNYNKGDSVIT